MKKESPRTSINKAKMLNHLKQNLGNVRKSCINSGIKKSTFYDWLKKDAEYSKAVLNIYRGCSNIAIVRVMEIIGDDINALVKIQKKSDKRLNIKCL